MIDDRSLFVAMLLTGFTALGLPAIAAGQSDADSQRGSPNEAESSGSDGPAAPSKSASSDAETPGEEGEDPPPTADDSSGASKPSSESSDSEAAEGRSSESAGTDDTERDRLRQLEKRVQKLEGRLDRQSSTETSETKAESSNKKDESAEPSDESSTDELSIDAQLDQIESEVGEAEEDDDSAGEQTPDTSSGSSGGAIQSMNPDISLILNAAGGWASGETDLRGGHDPNPPGVSLQGLELAAGADVDPFFRVDAAILFSLFGVEIEEIYATSLNLPLQLQTRVGQFKTRFGRLNPTHMHTWKFATQPLVNAKFFGGESLRGMGAELSQLLLPMPGTFRWYVAIQNVSGGATGRSFIPAKSDLESIGDLTVSARVEEFLELSHSWSLLTGLNYANGRNKTGRGNRTEIYGADLYLDWKNVRKGGRSRVGWQTEFMVRRRQVPGDVLEDYGGYSELFWRPGRYWETGLRYEYVSGVGPENDAPSIFGGSTQGVDPLDADWTEARQRGAFQITHYPSHFTKLRLQYSLDHLPYRSGTDRDEFVHMIFLQTEFVAGSHGAHSF